MPLLNSIVSWVTIKRLNQIELFKKYPIEVQNDIFKELINKARDTEWGTKYRYEDIIKDGRKLFNELVPVSTYEQLEPYIERVRKGEGNVLWPTDVRWFAKSSGTTNDKSKYIPVSSESLEECHFRGGRDIIAIYNNIYPDNNLFKGKSLAIGGSQQINRFDNNIFYGDLSAVLMTNLPFWVNIRRVPDLSIALMEHWDEKIDKMAHATINENVTNVSGVPSWTLVLFKRILEITGKKHLHEVWPNLELFIHGGVSFTPYISQYKKLLPDSKMKYFETYNASEGFFALQDEPKSEDMLLMLDYGVYYEFIPMEEFEQPNPKVLSLDQVEKGKNYAVVISTNGGLWRYLIGDTVMFTSRYPFKIKITGRTKHFINAFGEELIVDNAQQALKIASERTNAAIREYTAAPVYMVEGQKGGHEWLIEFEKEPDNFERFVEILDGVLKSVNSDYEAKRYKNMTLDNPKVHIAKHNLFYEWLEKRGKLGGQHKVPRLANNRKYIDELLELNK